MPNLRWGILSTANIARKNWKAVWHSDNSVVTAVASRDINRSREFVANCQRENPFDTAPTALGSYEELIASPNVDAIYVPIPTGLRKDWVVRAAEAGKHVLCEKPCGSTVAEVREMIDACRRHRVQFMDGVMFMHNPRLARIRAALDDQAALGHLKRITSHFSFLSNDDFRLANIRSNAALEPLGCLGDLGWYCIRITLWAMNWKLPRQVTGQILSQTGIDAARPVPFDFSAELLFDDKISAGFFCSFLSAYTDWVVATGTKGGVRIPDFVHPRKSSEGALDIGGTVSDDLITSPATLQEANMVRAFSSQVLSGKLNDAWPDWALKTQIVTNACMDAARSGKRVTLES
jgi:predicted dehydrogenase